IRFRPPARKRFHPYMHFSVLFALSSGILGLTCSPRCISILSGKQGIYIRFQGADSVEDERMAVDVSSLSEDRIASLEGLVSQGKPAAAVFTQFTQGDVDRIVKGIVFAGLEQAQYPARLAIEETRLGVLEDKALKNMVATEFVYNYVRDKPSVGVIREFPDRGIVEVAEPIGLIFSLTPITNPTSTVLFKCIMAIKTRNAVIFGPHPKAWRCCHEAIRIIYDVAIAKFAELGSHSCDRRETEWLGRTVIDPETGFMQPMAVGQNAVDIARVCGLRVKPDTKLLIAPIQGVGREHPLSVEKLFPVLAVYRAKSVDEALRVCMDVNHAGGLGHPPAPFSSKPAT